MKDIDTETSVVWPSWCYSDDIRKKLLKANADIAKDSLVCEPDFRIRPPITEAPTKKRRVTTDTSSSSSTSSSDRYEGHSKQYKARSSQAIHDKMLSERSLLLSGYNNNSIDSVKKSCEQSKTPPPQLSAAQASSSSSSSLTVTPTTTAAAAAAYLYLEKVKNERMSPRVTAAQIDSLKDAIMESSAAAAAVAAAMVNNNNCTSINNNNNNNNNNNSSSVHSSSSNHSNNSTSVLQIGNSLNNASDELHSHSLPPSIGQQQHHLHSNHVKRERLSPNATNGDLQSAISRSRSTTPSSFRGASPQHSVHSSPSETVVPMHNLSTNLLNSFQQAASSSGRHNSVNFSSGAVSTSNSGLPSDFSTRNYSDFMRSLAAKYNNTNPNDTSNSRRQAFFDATANNATKKTSTTPATKASYPPPAPSTSITKEVTITTTSSLPPPPPLSTGAISPGESALSHTQQSQMAAAAVASAAAASGGSVSPFMTSFLSSLPFAQGIFPPLIDMSSTQALITLARAAKESEIHNILHLAQNSTKRTTANMSPSPSPSLNMALQQAAQFISPALIYSAQLQKQQLVSRQSSPRSTNITNSSSSSANAASNKSAGEKRNASPLDLSSQPPASKRFKAESTSSQSSSDGQLDVTIKQRRTSTSTATTTPSPPPITEKSSSPVGPAPAEATTAAFTPMATGSSTSVTAGSAYAGVAGARQCQAHSEEVNSWTVHDVCAFVGSIDICVEYVKHFRDQSIDGSGLPLLTEDHLVNSLGMKLGPALKLRSMLAKKLGGPCPCVACVAQAQQMLALQTGAGIAAPTSSSGPLNATAVTDSGGCNSRLLKSNTLSNSAATVAGSNCSSNNSHSSFANKSDSTTTTTTTATSSSNAISAPSYNSIEGGSSNAAGNGNCNINIATFPPPPPPTVPAPAYSNCSSNYNNNIGGGSSSKSATSNRDDHAGSSSSTS